jgi:hypothetical protein
MTRRIFPIPSIVAIALTVSCARAPQPSTAPNSAFAPSSNARVAPADSSDAPVSPGDCVEANRRALAKPDLVVDRIPSPIVAKPPALQRPPRSALRKDGSADVKVDVVIDTLGRADMRTFKVVSASNAWLATNVKSVIAKWTFTPAELAGCKVPRTYHFVASAPGRSKSAQ